MKSIVASSLLALSLFSGVVSADDAKSDGASGKTIVIYATSIEEAQKQLEAQSEIGSSVVILVRNPDGTITELRGVNFNFDRIG